MPEDNIYDVTVYSHGVVVGWFEIEAPILGVALIRATGPEHANLITAGDQVDIALVKAPPPSSTTDD